MSSEVAEGWQWLRERLTDEPAGREPFDGEIGIEWPPGRPNSGWALIGALAAPFNADGPITTITEFTLHAKATDLIWATVTMFADEDGQPVYRTSLDRKLHLGEDGKPVTGTFRFLVTEMRVAASGPSAIAVLISAHAPGDLLTSSSNWRSLTPSSIPAAAHASSSIWRSACRCWRSASVSSGTVTSGRRVPSGAGRPQP